MSIQINNEKCIGCMRCVSVCPGSLIIEKAGKAYMKYPRDCWGCASCVKECKNCAIDFFLGADIGGNGSRMHVTGDDTILHWHIRKTDGTESVIDLDRRNANNY